MGLRTVAVLPLSCTIFDCVSHDTLVSKLNYYGVRDIELHFFKSYLSDRKQAVYLNGQFSDFLRTDSGVPQGSVLGPLLFLIMINDFSINVGCDTILFADDTTLYHTSRSIDIIKQIIANSAHESMQWFKNNGFLLNVNKTMYMNFSLTETKDADICDTVTLLGITLDKKLTWSSHVDNICARLSRVLYLLRHLKGLLP